jgi:hypothetical protein
VAFSGFLALGVPDFLLGCWRVRDSASCL